MERIVGADYLVVGAGAAGMAFTDALLDHSDASVVLVDRRHGVGGHWLDAYPFVRLHQASTFYGVASTLLGSGRVQARGPEAGLHERADAPEICSYYSHILTDRMLASGRVEFLSNCEYTPDRQVRSLISGRQMTVPPGCRVVDARYLAPSIPVTTPPPFEVSSGARVLPVSALARLTEAPSQYVVAGSGKTATDACLWLLARGVDAAAICWVRPREPWMLNRAAVQPNPAVFLKTAVDIMEAAAVAASPEDLFLRMEDAGIMFRIDRSVRPTMAKTPTLASWELDLLRTLENVVRLGHIRRAERGRLVLTDGSVDIAPDAVVVHCAASGLQYPPTVPIWGSKAITLQPIRAGFPCLGAALAGYVEASRDDDAEKNGLCPPTPYSNTMAQWVGMTVQGTHATMAFGSQPDIREWADTVALNPARLPPESSRTAELVEVLSRLKVSTPPGLAALAKML